MPYDGDLRAGPRDATGSPSHPIAGGMPCASVTALRDASEKSQTELKPIYGTRILSRDQAEIVAVATGRRIVPAIRIIEKILAEAGLSRAKRMHLIAGLRACPDQRKGNSQ